MDGTTGKPAVSTTSGFSGSSKGGVFSRKKAKYFGIGMVISRNSPSTTTSSLFPELHFMLKILEKSNKGSIDLQQLRHI